MPPPPPTPGRPRRLRTELTGSGWVYLGLSPLLLAAVLLDPRAAVVVSLWIALGSVQLVLARRNLAGLCLRLTIPEPRTRVGRAVPLGLRLEKTKGLLPAHDLTVSLRYTGRFVAHEIALPGRVGRRRPLVVAEPIAPTSFGRFFVNAAEVSSRFPFGLYRLTAEWLPPPSAELIVWPPVRRIPGRGAGSEAQPHPGLHGQAHPGLETRPYRPGDPLSLICWKTTARTGRPQARPRERVVLRSHELVVSTRRHGWSNHGHFWTMIALAATILEEEFRRGTLAALVLDGKHFTLRHPAQLIEAMDALCGVFPRRGNDTPAAPRRAGIFFHPWGRRGVRAVTDEGAVFSRVA